MCLTCAVLPWHTIVSMCHLTGGSTTLQWPAHSRLAVLACVHCQGGPQSFHPFIRLTHLFTNYQDIFQRKVAPFFLDAV